ncbi:MAG: tetratricopeptide repeat protein [Rubrivivax sp.]
MGQHDRRGVPSGSASAAAREAVEMALWRMMSFYDVPLADLDAAAAHDPGWAVPPLMKAGFLLSLTEPALLPEAEAHLAAARERLHAGSPERERAHVEALARVAEGRWAQAGRLWDQILLEHPHDALALQWAYLWDFYRGDAPMLRMRPARVLPEWEPADPLYGCVMGLYAFGLEECHEYAAAEDAGRQALQADARVPWAVHAVAHVMQMQGRFDDGAAWLRQHQPAWGQGNGFACHLWWHKALFRIEAMDLAGVLRLVDGHLSGEALQITLNRVDAAAMLWRLHLLGADVGSRCRALADGWDLDPARAGYYAFNDLHAVLALLGAGDLHGAEAWVAGCAERALAGDDLKRDNHAMAREVGLPLMRGLLLLARGDADGAVDALYPARQQAQRFGGSHAQRDLIDQTLLAAAARGHRRKLGHALLNERRMARPVTPLTRHWMEQLGEAEGVRA